MTKQSQIIREIEQMIAVGQVQPGEMLPTQKELMDRFGVAMGTVQQALGRLQTRGVVTSTRGKGTMVCDATTLSQAGIIRPRVEMLQLYLRDATDPLVADTSSMIQQTLSDSGFEMHIRKELPDSTAGLNLWAQNLRAVVAIGRLPTRVLQALRAADRPVIIVGELYDQPRPPAVSQVTVAVENIMQLAMASLMSQGHRRIVLGRGPDSMYYTQLIQSFRQTAVQMGLQDEVAEWMVPADTDGTDISSRWLAMSPEDRPTAMIVDGGQRACRVIYALQRENVQIPKDLSIFAISGQEYNQLAIPTLDRVETTAKRLGRRLAEVLLEVLQHRLVIRETIAPKLVNGDTCGPVPGQTTLPLVEPTPPDLLSSQAQLSPSA